jgi:hypothetical protein
VLALNATLDMAFRAPVLGYNTNVRHKGKLYHIQTEDSGIDHPHVITHLFADGGRIVASKKTSYAERVGSEGLAELVKKLMQAQHKAMFISLRDGLYDEDGAVEGALEQTGTHAISPDAKAEEPKKQQAVPPPPPAAAFQGTQAATADKAPSAKPPKPRSSLFGGGALSDKSLDEIILNYLAANEKES